MPVNANTNATVDEHRDLGLVPQLLRTVGDSEPKNSELQPSFARWLTGRITTLVTRQAVFLAWVDVDKHAWICCRVNCDLCLKASFRRLECFSGTSLDVTPRKA
ncbi:hypothetical protein CEXT_144501 [Caerostris extrusa]|uniref:Uncharacterized protein n=1 Tax=Caerostris extrusa TaxID=172846 RepID=A0AAV4Y5L6_CAEEX|nr:hypothetical protein CEXT_144501 [Caerostris extrusa]